MIQLWESGLCCERAPCLILLPIMRWESCEGEETRPLLVSLHGHHHSLLRGGPGITASSRQHLPMAPFLEQRNRGWATEVLTAAAEIHALNPIKHKEVLNTRSGWTCWLFTRACKDLGVNWPSSCCVPVSQLLSPIPAIIQERIKCLLSDGSRRVGK